MDDAERSELLACLEAGAFARSAGTDFDGNPHLAAYHAATNDTRGRLMRRLEAWWDGWEEVDRVLNPWLDSREPRFAE